MNGTGCKIQYVRAFDPGEHRQMTFISLYVVKICDIIGGGVDCLFTVDSDYG